MNTLFPLPDPIKTTFSYVSNIQILNSGQRKLVGLADEIYLDETGKYSLYKDDDEFDAAAHIILTEKLTSLGDIDLQPLPPSMERALRWVRSIPNNEGYIVKKYYSADDETDEHTYYIVVKRNKL